MMSKWQEEEASCSFGRQKISKLKKKYLLFTLYCLFLSWTVCPSWMCVEEEQEAAWPPHLHCRSIQGAPYVSTLAHTE